MAIEVLKKKKQSKPISGINAFLQISLFLFFLGGIAYFGVFQLHQSAEKKGLEIEAKIQEKLDEVPEREEIEKRIRDYFNLITDFKLIESNRFLSSYFFEPFQKAVHPGVEVFSANVVLDTGVVNFSGRARNIIVVGEQLKALQNIDYVENVSLSSLSIEVDEVVGQSSQRSSVNFSFVVEINPDLFKETEEEILKKLNEKEEVSDIEEEAEGEELEEIGEEMDDIDDIENNNIEEND